MYFILTFILYNNDHNDPNDDVDDDDGVRGHGDPGH